MARNPSPTVAAEAELPAPRFATAWASLIYAVATLMLAYPALGGAFLLNPRSDQYKAGYAFREFAAEHLRSGRGFPQWNPFLFGGMPYVGAMHGDIFYPTFLLRMIMPTDIAMTWEFPIHLFLSGLLTYLFLRAWNLGFYSAVIGGIAYMLGGSIAAYAGPGHDGKLFVSSLLPLTLLLLTRGMRDDRLWAWGALAITIGLGALSPHPQLLQYHLLAAGVFALYLAFADYSGKGPLPRPLAIKRLGLAAGAVVLGLLISAIQYMPLFKYKPWSPRAEGHPWDIATSYSFPIEETLNAYWPQFSGILDKYWGRNLIHFHSDYFGVIILMLMGAAFGASAAGRKSFRRIWVGIGIGSLLWAFGGYTPLFKIIFTIVPGTKDFRAPSTMIYVTALAVSVLAALGMERVLQRRVSPKYAIGWAIAAGVFAVLMSVGGYSALSSVFLSTMRNSLGPYFERSEQLAPENAGAAILGVWRSFLFVAIGAGLIWAWVTRKAPAKVVAIGLIAVAIVDLVSIERMYWIFSPRAKTLYASDPAIDAIKADMAKSGQWSRTWTEALSAGVVARDPAFDGDALMSHDLRIVGNYHGNELAMYDQLMAVGDLTRGRQPGLKVLSPQFWRHENVGYLYTGADDSTIATLTTQMKLPTPPTKLAGPVRNAVGSMVYAYRLPLPTTPAWVATGMFKAPPEQALATVLDPGFDPARIAIIDSSATGIQPPPMQALPAPSTSTAKVTASTDGSYDIALDQPAAAGSALVVSDNYYPGWTATADGKPATVARANYNLIGVALPTGAKSVQLRFSDPAYQTGKTISLIALAIALAAWIFGWVADRRRRTTATLAT